MGYRDRLQFDQPSAESIERSRRMSIWMMPLIFIQQGTLIFGHDRGLVVHLMGVLAWASVSLLLVWWILGLRLRWLSQEDQAILNDEWHQSISGDAGRWGIAALVGIGTAMMIARFWFPLDAGMAIYGLVNGALIVCVARYTWLNRAEPDEDE